MIKIDQRLVKHSIDHFDCGNDSLFSVNLPRHKCNSSLSKNLGIQHRKQGFVRAKQIKPIIRTNFVKKTSHPIKAVPEHIFTEN